MTSLFSARPSWSFLSSHFWFSRSSKPPRPPTGPSDYYAPQPASWTYIFTANTPHTSIGSAVLTAIKTRCIFVCIITEDIGSIAITAAPIVNGNDNFRIEEQGIRHLIGPSMQRIEQPELDSVKIYLYLLYRQSVNRQHDEKNHFIRFCLLATCQWHVSVQTTNEYRSRKSHHVPTGKIASDDYTDSSVTKEDTTKIYIPIE